MKINQKKLVNEIVDVIDNFYGLPEDEEELSDLKMQIAVAIAESEA